MINTPESIPASTQDYYKALLNARNQLFQGEASPRIGVSMLVRSYAQTIEAIQRDFGTGLITAERAEALIRQINNRLNRLGNDFNSILDRQLTLAMESAVGAHERGTAAALEQSFVNMDLNVQWDKIPEKAVDAMNVKRGLSSRYNYRTLMNRRIRQMQIEVDDFVQSIVARGVDAARASTELATMMAGNNPEVIKALERMGNIRLDMDDLRLAFKSGDLSLDEYRQIRTLLYDARRIIISEVNTGFRESDTIASFHSPVVGYLRWSISGRHEGLPSSPDICDIYAETNQFGLGSGVYPIENFPSSAHPFCGCYSQKVFRQPHEWNQPKMTAQQPRQLSYAEFEGMFSERTEKYLQTQVDQANYWNLKAYQYSQIEGFSLN